MVTDINNSKEAIKNRMLRYALNYWNIKNIEDLDPMVKLIMEALSLELYNLNNETKDTQVRILEKVASLLAPDFLTAPNPAHAILHATPVEPTERLENTASFITQYKIATRQNELADTVLDVYFTPVDSVQLVDAQIAYMVTNGNLFSQSAVFNRQLTLRAGRGRHTENNVLWLGLRVNTRIENINGLFFYFDWKNMEPGFAQRTYQLLPLTKWFLETEELTTKTGVPYTPQLNSTDSYENVFLEYDTLSLLEKDIKQYYDPKFMHIKDQKVTSIHELKKPYPSSFKDIFTDNDLQNLKESLLWIKIIFPATLQPDFLNELQVYPNAFPVMNRKVNDLKYRLKGGSNIIPLRTGALDQFLAVKSLSDETHEYKPVPYRKTEEEKTGTYALRKGGIERFDERNARELISYLLEMLRNENAAFAAYGYDFIATTLKEMNQKISLMEQKTKGYIQQGMEVPNYIIVKPFEGKDMMYAEYWTTLAEGANNLRAGTRMQQGKGVKVKQDSIALLTSTIGGKNRLLPEERLNAFRYGIMTRNRIITKDDIRNFCFHELGNRIQKVNIERGFEISANAKEAFRRTINVILIPYESEALESKEWQVLCGQLQSKLQTRSGMSNDYRILLRKE
jgi:hypothetical protein